MDNSDEKVIKHFPILEKMSTLTLEEKIILDEILSRYKKGQYLYKQSPLFRPLKSVMTEDVWKELHNLGVVEMFYWYSTHCACPLFAKGEIYLSRGEYADLKLYFRGQTDSLDENRIKKLEELLDKSGAVCSSCDLEFIIKSEVDLDNYIEIRIVVMMDKIK